MGLILITIICLTAVFGAAFYFFYRHFVHRIKKEYKRAQRSEKLKSVFLENISRSLRTPINAILGYSNLILEESDDSMNSVQIKDMAKNIKNDSEQVLSYIQQLVQLASFDGNMPAYTEVEVNLAELMASYRRETMTLVKPGVYVETRSDLSPHCKARLDTNFMHQLMMHLLTDAAKFTSAGNIIINYGKDNGYLMVSISYYGNSNADLLSQDLYTFLQKDALDLTKDNSALGLSMCKAIVDSLGGHLDIESENGRKTVASFKFPCKMKDCYRK